MLATESYFHYMPIPPSLDIFGIERTTGLGRRPILLQEQDAGALAGALLYCKKRGFLDSKLPNCAKLVKWVPDLHHSLLLQSEDPIN